MAVEQGHAGIVGCEINIHFLEATEHGDVFDDAGGGFAADMGQLEAMPVEVHGMDVVGGVAHVETVSFSFFEMEHRRHVRHVEGDAVDGPTVESAVGGIVFGEKHVDDFVGLGCGLGVVAEDAVVPDIGLWRDPLGFAFVPPIFDYDAHAVAAVVVGEVAHGPYAGVLHFHDGADAFSSTDP